MELDPACYRLPVPLVEYPPAVLVQRETAGVESRCHILPAFGREGPERQHPGVTDICRLHGRFEQNPRTFVELTVAQGRQPHSQQLVLDIPHHVTVGRLVLGLDLHDPLDDAVGVLERRPDLVAVRPHQLPHDPDPVRWRPDLPAKLLGRSIVQRAIPFTLALATAHADHLSRSAAPALARAALTAGQGRFPSYPIRATSFSGSVL